jgi:8-oxo-dGTP pyrophosphatase MutT (NUDIX family)
MPKLRVGALAVRSHKGRLQVAIVTTRGSGRWIIPKGRRERGMEDHEVAALEAFEEAGVITSHSAHEPLQVCLKGRRKTHLMIHVLHIDRLLTRWPERRERHRRLVELEDLRKWIQSRRLRRAVRDLAGRIDIKTRV